MAEYATLREANVARQVEWLAGKPDLTLSFRGNELAGEAGEAIEILTAKWMQGRFGRAMWADQLAQECADVIICTDLVCMAVGIETPQPIVVAPHGTDYQLSARLGMHVGKLCNGLKKVERSRLGIVGGIELDTIAVRVAAHHIMEVVGSILVSENIDGAVSVARKFNMTSVKNRLTTLYIPPGHDRAVLIPTTGA